MSNGYGYKTAVSPASTGGFPGYNYGYPAQGAATLPASAAMPTSMQAPMQMPMQSMQMPTQSMLSPMQTSMQMPMQSMQMPMQSMMSPMQMPMQSMQAFPPSVPNGSFITPQGGNVAAAPAAEESYVENIIRMNRGKMATLYMTYENNREWNAKIFRGVIEAAGRDHIIISDPSTGMRYLLLTLNLDYVTFEGPINYSYTFQGVTITNTTPTNATTPMSTSPMSTLPMSTSTMSTSNMSTSPATTATLGTTTLGREQV